MLVQAEQLVQEGRILAGGPVAANKLHFTSLQMSYRPNSWASWLKLANAHSRRYAGHAADWV